MSDKPTPKRRWFQHKDSADRDRIPAVLDVISVNSYIMLPFIFGLLGLTVCLVIYTISGCEYADAQTFGGYVAVFSVMLAGGTLVIIRRVRTIQHLFRHGVQCLGSVVWISRDGKSAIGPFRGEQRVTRRCLYEYKVKDKIYRRRCWFESPVQDQPLANGDTVAVLVDPHNPAVSVLMALYEA